MVLHEHSFINGLVPALLTKNALCVDFVNFNGFNTWNDKMNSLKAHTNGKAVCKWALGEMCKIQ